MQQTDFVRQRVAKYGGYAGLFIACTNWGFGAFLLWTLFNHSATSCNNHQLPLFMQVAGWTSVAYGTCFALYALVTVLRARRRGGYVQVEARGAAREEREGLERLLMERACRFCLWRLCVRRG